MCKSQNDFGRRAEDFVAEALAQKGWRIVARNFRHIGCELDIVAERSETLAIVEVKHRHSPRHADPALLLPLRKRRALAHGARSFLARHPTPPYRNVRFDLVLVATDPGNKKPRLIAYWAGVFDESDL